MVFELSGISEVSFWASMNSLGERLAESPKEFIAQVEEGEKSE